MDHHHHKDHQHHNHHHQDLSDSDASSESSVNVDKLYLLLPNHRCMFKKDCPFHAPEEREEDEEENATSPSEPPIYSKRRAMSLATGQDHHAISQDLLARKLARINESISSTTRLHLPRKTSQDISLSDFEPLRPRLDLPSSEALSIATTSSPLEEFAGSEFASTYTLDSGVAVGSSLCSDREDLIEEEEDDNEDEEEEEREEVDVPSPEVSDVGEVTLKNGEKVPEDDRHRTTFKDGEASIQITELSTEDAATYTCHAVNQLGEAETSATVHVEEVRHRRKRIEEHESTIRLKRSAPEYDMTSVDTNIPPEFTLPLVDQSRAVDDDVTFTVTVTCRPEPDVKWFHGKEEMTRSSRVSFQHDKGVYRVTILDLKVKDAGEYRCQAINAYGEEWCSCELKVIETVPAGSSKPRFIRELEYTSASEGSLVRLECLVKGEPKPSIKWFKDRQRIETDGHHKIRTLEDGTTTLVIENAEVEDTGCYMCYAENEAGSLSTEAKMKVHAVRDTRAISEVMTVSKTSSSVEASVPHKKYRVQVAPDFTAKLKDRRAPEGSSIRLNCSVTGIPEPAVKWFKDGREIFDGPEYTVRNNYGLLSLEIVYCKQSLSGTYKVEAANSEGAVSSSCNLVVEGGEEMSSIELEILRPRFQQEIEDITVNEGETAEFVCVATGKPSPTFKWQRDMINLSESRTIQMEYDNQGKATLTIRKVKVKDAGLYYCVAQSRSGRAKCSARLVVKAKSPSPMSPDEEGQARPRMSMSVDRRSTLGHAPSMSLYLPDRLEVVVGTSLKLDCSVQGLPYPMVTWHKGDRGLMYSQRHRIILCGTLHTMEIPSCMALDKGEYIVRATNIHGTIESRCQVSVLPVGSKVSAPLDYRRDAMREAARTANEVESDEEEEEDDEMDGKPQPKAPFFIKHLPRTIDVMHGTDVRLDCILRRGIELVRWSSSDSDTATETVKKELEKEGFHGEFIPLDKKDEAKPEKDLLPGQSPPTFAKSPVDIVRPVGGEAVFEATLEGTPEPQVKWYKDGRVLIATDNVRVSSMGLKHKLRLTSLVQSDDGQYECKATSDAGCQNCVARLTIQQEIDETDSTKTQAVKDEKEPPVQEPPVTPSSTSPSQTPSSSDRTDPSTKTSAPAPTPTSTTTFSQSLPSITKCTDGKSTQLTCKVKGDFTKVTWTRDDKEIKSNTEGHTTSSDKDTFSLTIASVKHQDHSGVKYACTVTTNEGSGETTTTSTVLEVAKGEKKDSPVEKEDASAAAPPTVPADAEAAKEVGDKPKDAEEEDDFKPVFKTPLKDTTVKDGEGLFLECDIEGNPRPQITWWRDGYEILDSQDFQISMIGSHVKLQVADIYPEDEGKYSVKAVNNLGETISTCYVTVEDPYMSTDSASTTSSHAINACDKVKVAE